MFEPQKKGQCIVYVLEDLSQSGSHYEYLHRFVATRNTRTSAALDELALMMPRCRADQFSRSFLPAAVRLLNLLPSGVFSGGTLSSFKRAMNLCLLTV